MVARVAQAAAIDDPMLPRPFRVTEAWGEIDEVVSMTLEPTEGEPLRFEAGQFNMLYAFGVGEAAISISGDPLGDGPLIHTIRNVGRVSAALTHVQTGDMLGVRGPFGVGWPVSSETGRHLLFMAGGLGLAPLRGAILQALRNRQQYAGITLLVGARSPREIIYAAQLADWAAEHAVDLIVTVDHAAPGWTGSVGVVTTRLDRALAQIDAAEISAYVCGPEVMMRFGCMALEQAGVQTNRMWVSMERNMKCAIGFCGHCQYGPDFVCKDGPVFRYDSIARRLSLREI